MRIVPEAERMDARVPLALLVISLTIIVLSGLLTVLVRSSSTREPPAGGLALTAPAGVPVLHVGTDPVQASSLFQPHGAAPSTRSLPAQLGGYGWVSRERGMVRIPITRAKQLYLEQLKHARNGTAPPQTKPAAQRGSP